MSSGVTYYNEEYAPIQDDYIAAQRRDNESTNAEVENRPPNTRRQNTRPKRTSKYDSEMYALPDIESDESPPPSPPPPVGSSRQLIIWKSIAVSSVVIGLLSVAAVVVYFTTRTPGTNVIQLPEVKGVLEFMNSLYNMLNII